MTTANAIIFARALSGSGGHLVPESLATLTGIRNKSTSSWNSKDKFAAVMETAAMNQAEVAAYCREKGLYPEQLVQWRDACEQANDWNQASEKKLKEATQSEIKKNKRLQKELDRKEKALAEAAALLVLRKKYNALFEDHEDES